MLGLCVGAAMPDVVDGIGGPLFRGSLGQWLGHTLVGLFTLCLTGGILLTWGLAVLGNWLVARRGRFAGAGQAIRCWNAAPPGCTGGRFLCFMGFAVWLGTLSHLCIDFISHGQFLWLYPWYVNRHFFPDWWYVAWFWLPVPGYRDPYPVGPHFMVWLFLGLLGAVMLFWPWLRRPARP